MMRWEEVKVLDANAEYLGVPIMTLMENAGWALAQEISSRFGKGTGLRIAILCGMGNNGGDGFVAARALTKENKVKVLLAYPPAGIRTAEARANFEKIEDIHKVFQGDDLSHYDIIIDAIVGVGAQGELRDQYKEMVKAINAVKRPVISVDIPSGLGTTVAVKPTITVTFHALKEGMDKDNCGEILVRDIGLPVEAERYVGPGDMLFYPVPSPESHKGKNGRLLVVGGGPYTGAPVLAGMAAYRIGADLVFVACPSEVRSIIASHSPDLITVPMPGARFAQSNVEEALALSKEVDAVLIGPGLGDDAETMKAVRNLIRGCDRPMVLDADALKAVAGHLDLLKGKSGVLTPHHRELELLCGRTIVPELGGRLEVAKQIALNTGWTLLVKGRVDIITDGVNVKYNRTGNPGMSVGGTGDVLAGITAGLLAKRATPFNSARISAFINGSAGDLAFEKNSYGLVATDLLDRVPQVLRRNLPRDR